ncbi:hypothetical protein QFC19_008336 [Naganishia cerealis]|uniref:Uncharacterized protein n=1 Tax=Naganishia cerealis TaxID=610337 RepID=A0ACC2V398_9TREE|nr:hypothetical protein QFC19_008336 [Naganishia cerealis]
MSHPRGSLAPTHPELTFAELEQRDGATFSSSRVDNLSTGGVEVSLVAPHTKQEHQPWLLECPTFTWSDTTGTSDIPLTEKGVEIMKRTAKKVVPGVIEPKNVSHVFVSPRKRAQLTADLLFNHDDKNNFQSFETENDVQEWDYGAYEGLKTHEIRQQKPDWDIWTDGCPPGDKYPGESPQQMSDRVDRVIAKIRAIHKEVGLRLALSKQWTAAKATLHADRILYGDSAWNALTAMEPLRTLLSSLMAISREPLSLDGVIYR